MKKRATYKYKRIINYFKQKSIKLQKFNKDIKKWQGQEEKFKVVTITELGILYFNQNGENKIKNSNVLAVANELN